MIEIKSFLLTILPIALSPGTSFILAMSNVANIGFRGIWPVIIGSGIGISLHSLLAGIGVSALLTSRPDMFYYLQIVGVLFLFYLGLKLLHSAYSQRRKVTVKQLDFVGVKSALMLNLVNVRAIVLYMTVLPVFAGKDLSQFLILSSIHIAILAAWIALIALMIHKFKKKIQLNQFRTIVNGAGGITLCVIAANLFIEMP